MMDLLALGSSGVRAYQAALNATGDNVANADTPGFVRRKVRLETSPTGPGGPLAREPLTGAGVRATGIDRSSDPRRVDAARVAAGDHSRLVTRSEWLGRLESVVTGADLPARLAGFFDAGSDLAASPLSVATRTIFVDRADQLAEGFRSLHGSLATLSGDLDAAARAAAGEINDLARGLAQVNADLRRSQSGTVTANGLLDRRDQLLAALGEQVRISVSEGAKGQVTVRIGTGAAAALLVPQNGNPVPIGFDVDAGTLVTNPGHDPQRLRLPGSGGLAGLADTAVRLRAMQQSIDATAIRIGERLNDWHAGGVDRFGDPGGPLFLANALAVTPGAANGGTATVDVEIDDAASLSPSGYRLIVDGTGFSFSRGDGSASVSGSSPLMLDGVTVTASTGALPGDGWTLATTAGAAGLRLAERNPARIATSDAFLWDSHAANLGDGRLTVTPDPGAAGFPASLPWRLTVVAPGLVEISELASGSVVATVPADGSLIEASGFRFAIAGEPAVGDSFRLLPAGTDSLDNGNIRRLAQARTAPGADGTIETMVDAAMTRLGTALAETDRLETTAAVVRAEAEAARDRISGVDLDSEAAELTRLQIAYRANAQVIATARDLFDTLLGLRG